MAINVNEKITDKLKKSNFRKELMEFLRDILIFELERSEEARLFGYKEKYESLMGKYIESEEGEG